MTRPIAPLLYCRLLIGCAIGSCLVTGQQSNAAEPTVGAPAVQLADHGGVCDGKTENNTAIANGLAAAKAKGVPLVIPAGQCNFSAVIHLDGGQITGSGTGSILYATNWQASSIFMSGASPSISNVMLTGVAAPSRQAPWESSHIAIFGATDFVVDHVSIEGNGGIVTARNPTTGQRATRGRITSNTVRNTFADGIHLTDGASFITVDHNVIENSGDDGIAVVSYKTDGARVSNITVTNNVVRTNRWGRNMSVVGGNAVTFVNNLADTNLAGYACLYIAQENSWNTYSALNVTATRNTFRNCGGLTTGHAAAMIFSDGAEANDNITLLANEIIQNGRSGIRYFGPQTRVRLEQNRITGTSAAYVGGAVSGVIIIPYTSGSVGYVAP